MATVRFIDIKGNRTIRMVVETKIADIVNFHPGSEQIQDALDEINPRVVIADDNINAWFHHDDIVPLFKSIVDNINQ